MLKNTSPKSHNNHIESEVQNMPAQTIHFPKTKKIIPHAAQLLDVAKDASRWLKYKRCKSEWLHVSSAVRPVLMHCGCARVRERERGSNVLGQLPNWRGDSTKGDKQHTSTVPRINVMSAMECQQSKKSDFHTVSWTISRSVRSERNTQGTKQIRKTTRRSCTHTRVHIG